MNKIPRPSFCNHYRAMSEHDTCEAGVAYSTFPRPNMPCFCKNGVPSQDAVPCSQAQYPTPEQVREWEAYINQRLINTAMAREAIVNDCGGPWKRGIPGKSGQIPCPVCKTGTLGYSRAGYNGHVHAACNTPECVRWME